MLREYMSNTYDVLPYFLAKTIAEGPLLAVVPLLYSLIVYFGIGLRPDFESYMFFYFALYCLN